MKIPRTKAGFILAPKLTSHASAFWVCSPPAAIAVTPAVSSISEMCSERDSPLEPFVLPAPGQPELARLICGAHLGAPVLTRKQKRPRVNSLVCDRAAAFCAAGPPEVLSRMSRPVTQAAERERELARARSQRLKQAAPSLPGESVSRGFADRGAVDGYPSHYTSLSICKALGIDSPSQAQMNKHRHKTWSFCLKYSILSMSSKI